MKKLIIGVFAMGMSFMASAQNEKINDLKKTVIQNSYEDSQSDFQSEIISYHLQNERMEQLETFALEVKESNPKAYSRFCWELTTYYLGKGNMEKYTHYTDVMKAMHPDDLYIQDGLKFNEISLSLSKLGRFVEPMQIEEKNKEAILELATSPTFFGRMACELSYKYFNERPCDTKEKELFTTSKQLDKTKEVHFVSKLSIFPNPSSSGVFTVELTDFVKDKKIRVFNVLGLLVSESTISDDIGTIDISGFARGVYFIKVNDNSQEKTARVVFE